MTFGSADHALASHREAKSMAEPIAFSAGRSEQCPLAFEMAARHAPRFMLAYTAPKCAGFAAPGGAGCYARRLKGQGGMKQLRCLGGQLDGRFIDDGAAPTVFLEKTAGDGDLELVTDHRLPPVAVHYRKIRINRTMVNLLTAGSRTG